MASRRFLRWGILSTGRIAGIFAEGLAASRTGKLVAVGSRSAASAEAFARRWKAPRAHGSYAALLKDPGIDAVYIATPHPFHAEWTLRAARAGKHVLCEKPLAMNHAGARRMVEAARKHRVFLMEAFMYRFSPQTLRLADLVRRKTLGELRLIEASFCFDAPLDLRHRLFNRNLGGGAILDVGCYPVSMARLLAGAALGKPFAEPLEVKGAASVGARSGVDEWASAVLKFPGGILAELSCGVRLGGRPPFVRLSGSHGTLTVPSPWFARWRGGTSHILLERTGRKSSRRIPIQNRRFLYSLEADAVAGCVAAGRLQCQVQSWADSLGNMRALDLWRESAGLSLG